MKPIPILVAALLLAGCGPAGEKADADASPKAAAEPPAAIPAGPSGGALFIQPLTQEGWGEVRIGMSHDEAVAALGGKVQADASTRDETWRACHMIAAAEPEGLWAMVENDRVTRLTLRSGNVRTDAGLKVGDPRDRVLETYPDILEREPHKYQEPPAEYLTWWARPDQSGIRYSIGQDGRVQEIHAGGPSIRYVEGCG
jgi:hypothetical protein